MDAYQAIRLFIQQHQLNEARSALLEMVKLHPRDALAWELLAELMVHLQRGETARLCYRRAILLQPFQNGQLRDLPPQLHGLSSEHDHDVEFYLRVPRKTVGAALIVKDASRTIAQSLRSLLPAVDQIVVVDTGSTDGTVSIVQDLGIEVHHEEWHDDFAAARNQALSYVTTDWVISIDSDEILYEEDIDSIREIAGLLDDLPTPFALQIFQMNRIGSVLSASPETRLFPRKWGLHWIRPIHEQLVSHSQKPIPVYPVRIRVLHDGYDPRIVDVEQKYRRNVAMLLQHVEHHPDDKVSHSILGREFLMLHDPQSAIHHLQLAHTLMIRDPKSPRESLMGVERNLILAYEQSGDWRTAMSLAEQMTQNFPTSVDARYLYGYYQMNSAVHAIKTAMTSFQYSLALVEQGHHAVDPTIGSFKAKLHMADLQRLSGDWVSAMALYSDILTLMPDFEEVKQLIAKIKQQVVTLANL